MALSLNATKRDCSIDFMRFVGIALIILAHTQGVGKALYEFRSFDVPLMVFVSGLCFSGKTIDSIRKFIFKRTPRLIIPLYLFLTIYFLLLKAVESFGIETGLTTDHIVGSYLLLEGIGFVWIIRVFLLIMLLTPLLIWIYKQLPNIPLFCLFLIFIQTILVKYCASGNDAPLQFIFREYILYATGYSVIFLCGMQAGRSEEQFKSAYIWYFALAVFFVYYFVVEGTLIPPINNNKYPPAGIYIIYGIAVSFIFNQIRPLLNKLANRFTDFIGANTMWVYLYHIPFYSIFVKVNVIANLHWSIRYIALLCLAVLITYVQISLSHIAERKWAWNGWKYLRG